MDVDIRTDPYERYFAKVRAYSWALEEVNERSGGGKSRICRIEHGVLSSKRIKGQELLLLQNHYNPKDLNISLLFQM